MGGLSRFDTLLKFKLYAVWTISIAIQCSSVISPYWIEDGSNHGGLFWICDPDCHVTTEIAVWAGVIQCLAVAGHGVLIIASMATSDCLRQAIFFMWGSLYVEGVRFVSGAFMLITYIVQSSLTSYSFSWAFYLFITGNILYILEFAASVFLYCLGEPLKLQEKKKSKVDIIRIKQAISATSRFTGTLKQNGILKKTPNPFKRSNTSADLGILLKVPPERM